MAIVYNYNAISPMDGPVMGLVRTVSDNGRFLRVERWIMESKQWEEDPAALKYFVGLSDHTSEITKGEAEAAIANWLKK